MKKLVGYFLQGLLYTVPIFVTVVIIYKLLDYVQDLIPFEDKFWGLGVIILGLTAFGWLGSTILMKALLAIFDGILKQAPLIKVIYTSVKDLLSAFVGKKKRFDKPVLVRVSNDSDLEKVGFITRENLENLGVGDDRIAVYLPHSYAFSGNLFIVPRENVRPLEGNSSDVMKFIVSGGVAEL